ncbi:MAG: lauroyl acyltransferase [Magnetospirillum sp.]|nr:lauroyl acyltransferase [Magnetospirillum sp.]
MRPSIIGTVRHAIEAVAAFAGWLMFAALPVEMASAFGGWFARKVGPLLKVSTVARRNLLLAFPEKGSAEIEQIVLSVWDNFGRLAGEFPHLKRIAAERLEIIGAEHVIALRDDGLPGILIGAHFGGWELSGPLAERLGLPVHVVYRAANNPWIERLFRAARGVSADSVIAKGSRGARKVLAVMRNGGHLGVLVDQKMNDGIAVPFMGRDAMTAPAVAQLALRFHCPVVAGRIERLPGVRFRAVIEPPIPLPNSGDHHRDVLEMMTRINAVVESWVRENPGQWLWLHRRWPKPDHRV